MRVFEKLNFYFRRLKFCLILGFVDVKGENGYGYN